MLYQWGNTKLDFDKFTPFMNESKPIFYAQTKNLICDWSDKKKYLIHYRRINLYIEHEMIFDKIHEINSFKRSKWLEKFMSFSTQKRAKIDFEREFFELLNNAFFRKTKEIDRNRVKLFFIRQRILQKFLNNNQN